MRLPSSFKMSFARKFVLSAFLVGGCVIWLTYWNIDDSLSSPPSLNLLLTTFPRQEYMEYLERTTAFDFCGTATQRSETVRRGLEEVLDSMRLRDARDFPSLVRFQRVLEEFEHSWRHDSREDFFRASGMIRKLLMNQKADSCRPETRFSIGNFCRSIERVEYSMVRLLEFGCSGLRLTESDVVSVLPDELFDSHSFKGCDWAFFSPDDFRLLRVFREMIVLGCHVRAYFDAHGRPPRSLQDIGKDSRVDRGGRIAYSTRGVIWQMFYPESPKGQAAFPFNVYIPVVLCRTTEWPLFGCLWLSSDFAEKRLRLYQTGTLNEETADWACEFRHGRIRKLQRHTSRLGFECGDRP